MPHPHMKSHGCAPCEARRREVARLAAEAARAAGRGDVKGVATHAVGVITGLASGALAMAGLIPKEMQPSDLGLPPDAPAAGEPDGATGVSSTPDPITPTESNSEQAAPSPEPAEDAPAAAASDDVPAAGTTDA